MNEKSNKEAKTNGQMSSNDKNESIIEIHNLNEKSDKLCDILVNYLVKMDSSSPSTRKSHTSNVKSLRLIPELGFFMSVTYSTV